MDVSSQRRMFIVLLSLSLLLFGLAARLLAIQSWEKYHYTAAGIDLLNQSFKQRVHALQLDDGRGHFYDRHMNPLTGQRQDALAVFPALYRASTPSEQQQLVNVLGIERQTWDEWVENLSGPALWQADYTDGPLAMSAEQVRQIEQLHLPGITVVPYERRYPIPYTASHVIGYTSQHPEWIRSHYATRLQAGDLELDSRIGASGLEKSFDELLHGPKKTVIFHLVDGLDQPLAGTKLRYVAADKRHYPLQVVMTLDKSIQVEVENILANNRVQAGAAVLLDADTADIVAMASRPDYDPLHVDPLHHAWQNRALKTSIPGSIFKTITAAAVLEQRLHVEQESIFCSGELGRYGFSCWKEGGHGHLTLAEAYAKSCNIAFAQAALSLPPGKLEQTAAKFGLLETNGWMQIRASATPTPFTQLDGEERGQVFAPQTNAYDPGVLVQTAIGQRDVRISPLAAANMVATIIHDGAVKRPRIVREIRDASGGVLKRFPTQRLHPGGDKAVSRAAAATIRQWMRQTVTEGTGQVLRDAVWELAGKSGTAQVSAPNERGAPREHQWFVGYGPAASPRFILAVYVENTDGLDGHVATRVFGEIFDALAQMETAKG